LFRHSKIPKAARISKLWGLRMEMCPNAENLIVTLKIAFASRPLSFQRLWEKIPRLIKYAAEVDILNI
jgi:hypothetical protein